MSNFCSDQGRTRVFGEAYSLYAAAGNPGRTQIRAKRAIYVWKLNKALPGEFSDATGQKRKEVGGLLGFQAWQFFR